MIYRKFEKTDLAIFEQWLYAPHVSIWYHEPEAWMAEVEDANGEFNWINHYIVEEDGKAIGFCQYYEYVHSGEDWHGTTKIKGTYSIDYMIGEPSYLRKGFGKKIIQELINRITEEGNAERIIVQPESENEASCKTLLSCGFAFNQDNSIYIMEL